MKIATYNFNFMGQIEIPDGVNAEEYINTLSLVDLIKESDVDSNDGLEITNEETV